MNVDCNFHSIKVVAATAEEVVGFELSELKHVSPFLCYVLDKVLVNAVFIACLIHLQHIVLVLVKSKIFEHKLKMNKQKRKTRECKSLSIHNVITYTYNTSLTLE